MWVDGKRRETGGCASGKKGLQPVGETQDLGRVY